LNAFERERNIRRVKPSAKSLILDLLAILRRGSMPLRALVEAGALFGLAENNLRVALARLNTGGAVERDASGAYRLGERSEAIDQRAGSWRELSDQIAPWSGNWVGVLTDLRGRGSGDARGNEATRKRQDQALEVLGFRSLEPALAIRPDNLVGGVSDLRARLTSLVLPSSAPRGSSVGPLVFALRDLDATSEVRALGLWNATSLIQNYEDARQLLHLSEARIADMSEEKAMVESFLVGGQVLRQIVFDPLLPESIVPGAPRSMLLAAMVRYDDLARRCWGSYLERFASVDVRPPVNLRGVEVESN
jgi:phenylacetic acid degradation operon negative regulatory protein